MKFVYVFTVSRLLSSMGEILTGLDIKTAAELWKAFIVFTQTYKDHLKSRLNIGPALKFLSSEVTDTIPTIINSVIPIISSLKFTKFIIESFVFLD